FFRVGRTGAVVHGSLAPDRGRGRDRALERRSGKIRGAGVAAPRVGTVAEVNRDADTLVEIVLDRFGFVLAYGDREAVAFGNFALACGGASALCRVENDLRELLELRRGVRKAICFRHD